MRTTFVGQSHLQKWLEKTPRPRVNEVSNNCYGVVERLSFILHILEDIKIIPEFIRHPKDYNELRGRMG